MWTKKKQKQYNFNKIPFLSLKGTDAGQQNSKRNVNTEGRAGTIILQGDPRC
jgi:hypothetical protein